MSKNVILKRHSEWYWKHYDLVFGRGQGYENDLSVIASVINLENAVLQEIGSGKGDHAQLLLDHGANYLELIDNDNEAINKLRFRFGSNKKVSIVKDDGFNASPTRDFDAVLCMYSVALQLCKTIDFLIQRVNTIMSRLKPDGVFAFEAIDYERSKHIYPTGQESLIFSNEQNHMSIASHYFNSTLRIRYEGVLDRIPCSYSVDLLRVTAPSLSVAIEQKTGCQVRIVNLDSYGRRILVVVKK